MPFAIDLDPQTVAWTPEEREVLDGDPISGRYLLPMPGNIHCRPDGGEGGQWIKLGWAYNTSSSEPSREPELDPNFPEIVLRAASRMLPRLTCYIGSMPRERSHYGGYYAMTRENWPLIGPSRTPGAFLATALSGYGTMAACATGDLCARAITGAALPVFAGPLSIERYNDQDLMFRLESSGGRGLL
jgi:glycine/D-amino acid oxidase-like deaminating enzyme